MVWRGTVGGSAQLVGGEHDVLYRFEVNGVSREDGCRTIHVQSVHVSVSEGEHFLLPACDSATQRHMPALSEGEISTRTGSDDPTSAQDRPGKLHCASAFACA